MLDSDNHDLLIQAMVNYIDAKRKYEFRGGRNTAYATKRWLREIRRLSRLLIKEYIADYAEQEQNKRKNLRKGDSELSK